MTNNADIELVQFTSKEKMKEELFSMIATKNKNHLFLVGTTFSVLLFNDFILDERIKKSFKDIEVDLKKEEIYEEKIYEEKVEWLYSTYHQMLKYYEITLIKKFYSKKLLNEINNSKTLNRKVLSKYLRNLDFLLLNFDEEILFRFDGSPKLLYKKANELSGSKHLFEKSKTIIYNLEKDIKNEEELKNESFRDRILLFTTILSAILSFGGIKTIVYTILEETDFGEKINIIYLNPFSMTLFIWGIMFIVFIYILKRKNK